MSLFVLELCGTPEIVYMWLLAVSKIIFIPDVPQCLITATCEKHGSLSPQQSLCLRCATPQQKQGSTEKTAPKNVKGMGTGQLPYTCSVFPASPAGAQSHCYQQGNEPPKGINGFVTSE